MNLYTDLFLAQGKRLKPTQPRESDMATSSTQKESFNKRMNEVVKQQHDDAAQAQHRELFLQEIKQGSLIIRVIVLDHVIQTFYLY